MKKRNCRLLIIGAGGFGREILMTAKCIPPDHRDWEIGGFIDDDPDRAARGFAGKAVDAPILGTVRDHQPKPDERFVCAIGNPRVKLDICEGLAARGAQFTTLIHPTAEIGPGTTIGDGGIVLRGAGLTVDCRIGRFVTINALAGSGHDGTMEDGCTLSAHSEILGGGYLERGAFLGSHAVVLAGVRIGAFATVGAGSVAIRKVAPGATVFGIPARPLNFGG